VKKVSVVAWGQCTLAADAFGAHGAVKTILADGGLEAKKKEEEVLVKERKAEGDASLEGLSYKSHIQPDSTDLPILR